MKMKNISPHVYLLIGAINNPTHTSLVDISNLAVFLGCFDHFYGERYNRMEEGMAEELFFALVPKNEEEIFFYWEIARHIEQILDKKEQQDLLYLLRRKELL